MIGLMHPPRDLTPEERTGFRIALGMLATWGGQMASASALTGGRPEPMQPVRLLQARAEFLVDCCAAMDLTVGGQGKFATQFEKGAVQAAATPSPNSARWDGAGPKGTAHVA